jgi:site-specific DNA recombinase
MNRQPDEGAPARTGSQMAAIYARVSTEDQGKGFSLPTQIEACQKLAERESYTVPEAHVLLDEGISGTTLERPGLRTLRELVNARTIQAVIVYDPDRLSRNLGHQLLLTEEMEHAAVKLLIVSHPMEQGPEGWLFFQMRGALAEYERAKILERTRRGLIGRAQSGHPHGGQVPLGYAYLPEPHGGRWVIDEDEAPVVRRIFSLCLEGLPVRTIARLLTDERVPTRLDRHHKNGGSKAQGVGVWSASSIHQVLTNQAYTGTAYFNQRKRVSQTTKRQRPKDEWVAFTVPPIIDQATFHAAQEQLHLNQVHAKRNQRREYLLSGRIRCAQCGRAMGGTATLQGKRRYRCTSRSSLMDQGRRCPGSLSADQAESRVWQAIEHVLQQPDIIAREVARQQAHTDEQRTALAREIALIEDALAKCDREEQRWAQAYVGEVINLAELKGYRAEIGARRQSLCAQRATLQARIETLGEVVGQVEALISYCARVSQRLQTFNSAEKRLAFEALNILVTWAPGQDLKLEGTIPLADIASIPSRWSVPPTLGARTAPGRRQRFPG